MKKPADWGGQSAGQHNHTLGASGTTRPAESMTIPTTVQHPASVDAYIRHGWSLVPIPPGSKGPRTQGWNRREAALRSQSDVPHGHGIGLAHAYSGTMALDIDDWATATSMLMLAGIDLPALYDAPDAVVIDSGRQGHGKLVYAMPFGLTLPSKRVTSGSTTAYELRCATVDGLTVQDVLPPTIHPQTQQPYRWAGRGHWSRLPMLPLPVLDLWQSLLVEPEQVEASDAVPTSADWDHVKSALDAIPPDCSRDEWISVGMAIHHAATAGGEVEAGFALWNRWSAGGVKYPGQRALQTQWKSFKSDKSTVVRLGTLFSIAQRYGWTRPQPDVSALFAPAERITPPETLAAAIQDGRLPVPTMRLEWWPRPLAQRAQEVSEHIGCDPIVPLFSGLAAVAGAIDAQSRLKLMEGYEVPPVVWLMTIGSPADKKTPGSAPMIEPLHAIEAEDLPRWRRALLEWEGQEAAYSAAKKHFLDVAASPDVILGAPLPDVPDLPPQPQPLRIKVSDITSQKLVRYAADRPRGLLCYLDEMAAWCRKMADKTSGEDRSAWVQAYEARRYEFDRVTGGAIIAECFAVSVYGNIQPAVYKQAIEGLALDGLLQRFVPGILNTRLTRRGEPRPTTGGKDWEQIVRLVYSLPATTYTLAPDAYEVFRDFQTWFEQTKRDNVVLEADGVFLTALGKLEGTTARIALLFHVIESPFSTVVSKDTLARAIAMTRNYIILALRYTLGELAGETFDGWVQSYLLYHAIDKEQITLSDVKRGARRRMEKVQNIWLQDRMVIDAMETLEGAGWVIRIDDRTREHLHQAEWAINPALKTAFRDQQREIIKARQRAEDERRRIAKIERKIVPGYETEWDDELMTGT